MMFSCWNQSKGRFDYWETPTEQAKLNTEKPSHIPSRKLGATVDQAAWPLPGNARKVGEGDRAVGRIATRGGSALGGLLNGSQLDGLVTLAAVGTIGYFGYEWFMKRKGR